MIYVIQPEPGGPVKIGYTRETAPGSVRRRMAALEPGCPWPLKLVCTLPGGRYEEAQLHDRFAALRVHREWFRLEGELALWLRGLAGERVGPAMPERPRVVPLRRAA